VTGREMKAAMEYRGKMIGFLESGAVIEAGQDWIRMELHNQEREMRGEVAASIRQERKQEIKNARLGGRAQGLRGRLKHLISSILAQREVKRNA